jgi:TonB family protein
MFAEPRRARRNWNTSLLVSFALHAIILYVLVRPPRPIYVTPSQVAFGHGGTSTELIYFSRQGSGATFSSASEAQPRHIALNSPAKPSRPKPRPKPPAAEVAEQAIANDQPSRAGSPFGSLTQGPIGDHDIRPALPVVYPNPDIFPWQIPSGVEGTVIVEVTIDAQGNVTETRVLKALGYGIEDKVVAALRNWRFRPAMMDGRAISSQQDVYFHFPT